MISGALNIIDNFPVQSGRCYKRGTGLTVLALAASLLCFSAPAQAQVFKQFVKRVGDPDSFSNQFILIDFGNCRGVLTQGNSWSYDWMQKYSITWSGGCNADGLIEGPGKITITYSGAPDPETGKLLTEQNILTVTARDGLLTGPAETAVYDDYERPGVMVLSDIGDGRNPMPSFHKDGCEYYVDGEGRIHFEGVHVRKCDPRLPARLRDEARRRPASATPPVAAVSPQSRTGTLTGSDAAYAAQARGDFNEAQQLFLTLAEAGDVDSQTALGWMYMLGLDGQPDYAMAEYWLVDTLWKAIPDGAVKTALKAYTGQDYPLALSLLEPLAQTGDAHAQTALGFMHLYGWGVPQNSQKAHSLFTQAMTSTHGMAQKTSRLSLPAGEPQQPFVSTRLVNAITAFSSGDFNTAFALFKPLAEKGVAEAQFYLARLYLAGNGTTSDAGLTQHWFQRAANQGHADAQFIVGYMHEIGFNGLPKNPAEAARWVRLSADQGNPFAQEALGRYYAEGTGVAQNYGQAANWYRKAAEQNYAKAQNALGVMLMNGQGVRQNLDEAEQWFVKAVANQPDLSEAQANLNEVRARKKSQ